MSGAEQIRAQALEVAADWSPPDAPGSGRLTAALFQAIAAHDELPDRLAALPADHLPALLASAAVSWGCAGTGPHPWWGISPSGVS
jgi:hypothetical protein